MPIPRTIALALATLTLSALTTTTVAWALACTNIPTRGLGSSQVMQPKRGPLTHFSVGGPPNGVKVDMFQAPGRVFARATCLGPDCPMVVGSAIYYYEDAKAPPDELIPAPIRSIALPWLCASPATPWPRGSDIQWCEVEASGFPFLALASWSERAQNFTRAEHWTLTLPGKRYRAFGEHTWGPVATYVLPLRPLFPGFALDTLAAAPVWYILLLLPGALRRTLRKRRNQCPHCAYSRTGLAKDAPCPECGRTPHR